MTRMRQLCKDQKGEHSKPRTASARAQKQARTRSRSGPCREGGKEQLRKAGEAGLGFHLRQDNTGGISVQSWPKGCCKQNGF